MTDKNFQNQKELVWGEISPLDILKKKYNTKPLKDMSDKEVSQMLEDLI